MQELRYRCVDNRAQAGFRLINITVVRFYIKLMRQYCLTETHFRSVMNETVLSSDFASLLVNR